MYQITINAGIGRYLYYREKEKEKETFLRQTSWLLHRHYVLSTTRRTHRATTHGQIAMENERLGQGRLGRGRVFTYVYFLNTIEGMRRRGGGAMTHRCSVNQVNAAYGDAVRLQIHSVQLVSFTDIKTRMICEGSEGSTNKSTVRTREGRSARDCVYAICPFTIIIETRAATTTRGRERHAG